MQRLEQHYPETPVPLDHSDPFTLLIAVLLSAQCTDKKVNEDFSLGITLNESGVITDLVPGSPADAVGLAPDMKVIAVNGRRYSKNVLRDALTATPSSGRLELLCEVKEFYRTFLLAYRDGRRHPVLVRENGTRDVVTEVTSARAR